MRAAGLHVEPALLLSIAVLTLLPPVAWPQGNPLGPEFRVNTYTTGEQDTAAISADASGNFVVVWRSDGGDGSGFALFGQRYASSGVPFGPEFRVNTYTPGNQENPSIASDASGNFVVVWESPDGSFDGISGQRYASSGVALGAEFRVNAATTTGSQTIPSVATDLLGNFVVVWLNTGPNYGIAGQRFASSGAPLGPEFRVNTFTPGANAPSVARDASGGFVVVWENVVQDGSFDGVYGQRYAASGVPLGPEFRVNTVTTDYQNGSEVATDASGNFVVVWHSYAPLGAVFHGIFGQRFANSGLPLGPEFRVNTTTGNAIWLYPSVASDSSGNFVVAWDYVGDVFGQRFASSGVPMGPEFRVNTHTTSFQFVPSVGVDAAGAFIVVWTSNQQDGSSDGVFGQRFGPIVPVELMHLSIE